MKGDGADDGGICDAQHWPRVTLDPARCDVDWTPQGRVQVPDDVLGVVSLAPSGLGISEI